MDSRLSVLNDLLTELGEGDPAAGLRRALEANPRLWLQVPRDALVALPWVPHGDAWYRYAAGSEARIAEIEAHRTAPPLWRAMVCGVRLRLRLELQTWSSTEEARTAADAALRGDGWVIL